MAVRLLSKHEIQRRKSEERRQEIEEGLKVARRVDALRETLASEETSLEQYRSSTLKAIQNDLQETADKKNSLLSEIAILERRRSQLQVPLDAAWSQARALREEARLQLETNQVQAVELKTYEARLQQRSVEIQKEQEVISLQKDDIATEKLQASSLLEKANNVYERSVEQLRKFEHLQRQKEEEFSEIEKEIQAREKEIQYQQERIRERNKMLQTQELELQERYLQMEATAKRLREGKL